MIGVPVIEVKNLFQLYDRQGNELALVESVNDADEVTKIVNQIAEQVNNEDELLEALEEFGIERTFAWEINVNI